MSKDKRHLVCPECGREDFTNRSSLKGHRAWVHGLEALDKLKEQGQKGQGEQGQQGQGEQGQQGEQTIKAKVLPDERVVQAKVVPGSEGIVQAKVLPEYREVTAKVVPDGERRQSMARYDCEGRYCTDGELDELEAIRRGEKKLVGKDEAVAPMSLDLGGLDAKLEEIAKSQGVQVDTESIIKGVAEEITRHPMELVDFPAFLAHTRDCPNCDAQLQHLVRQEAIRQGYTPPEGVEAEKEQVETAQLEG